MDYAKTLIVPKFLRKKGGLSNKDAFARGCRRVMFRDVAEHTPMRLEDQLAAALEYHAGEEK